MWNKIKILIFIFSICFSALCYAQNVEINDSLNLEKKYNTTTKSPVSLSIDLKDDENAIDLNKKHNKTTTSIPSTTASTTSKPTPKPTSTTPTTTPTTTTTTTTTPTTTTTTTTENPTTTTSTTTTEGPKTTTPSPKPKPDIGEWNTTCIRLKFAVQATFKYNATNSSTLLGYATIPSNATVYDNECLANKQSLSLRWGSKEEPDFFNINFIKKNEEYSIHSFHLSLQSNEFPNGEKNSTILLIYENNSNNFTIPLQMSYHCTTEEILNLKSDLNTNDIIGFISVKDFQFEAFYTNENTSKFSIAKDCDAIDTPDIVPIAVGIALTALILIVLISFLVARRRSTSRGYTSF